MSAKGFQSTPIFLYLCSNSSSTKVNMKSTFDRFFSKVIAFTIVALSILQISFAQDIIETKSGERIMAKVVDVGQVEVKYKLHDDIMGPMQSITNQDLVLITFSNGTIKRFVELPKPIDMMAEPHKYKVVNSDKSVLWEYQFDNESIFNGSTINYYGLDMSHLVFINANKANQDESLRHYLPSWQHKFNSVITSSLIKRGLQTTRVMMKNEKAQSSHELVPEDWVKDSWDGLTIEEVITAVSKFRNNIEEQEGVGFIIILDNFNQSKNKVSAIFTFFEVDSGAVLWASKVEGNASDNNVVNHWGFGMVRMYHQFRLAVYETKYRVYRKNRE